jgi:hypothetical protein
VSFQQQLLWTVVLLCGWLLLTCSWTCCAAAQPHGAVSSSVLAGSCLEQSAGFCFACVKLALLRHIQHLDTQIQFAQAASSGRNAVTSTNPYGRM